MLYPSVHLKYLDQYSALGRSSKNVFEFNRNDIWINESNYKDKLSPDTAIDT